MKREPSGHPRLRSSTLLSLYIYPTLRNEQDVTQGQFFWCSTAGLNSEFFFFFRIVAFTRLVSILSFSHNERESRKKSCLSRKYSGDSISSDDNRYFDSASPKKLFLTKNGTNFNLDILNSVNSIFNQE